MITRVSWKAFRSLEFSAGGPVATRIISQPLGAAVAWAASRAGLTPSAVTVFGLSLFLASAALFATLPPGGGPTLMCFLMFQLAYAFDCADGQLARATSRSSIFGAWLDLACDYIRNIVIACAIFFWLASSSNIPLWIGVGTAVLLACGAAVQLHTITILRQHRENGTSPKTGPGKLRKILVAAIDTPILLTVLCALRELPVLLCLYTAVMGVLYLSAGVLQAWKRLRPL